MRGPDRLVSAYQTWNIDALAPLVCSRDKSIVGVETAKQRGRASEFGPLSHARNSA
jgi:hypothetical protein